MEKEMILIDSEQAARFVTGIEGWIDRHGRFFGNNEESARWSGCTHRLCEECQAPVERNYTICDQCKLKKDIERYHAKEKKVWDGTNPLYSDATDGYYFDLDEIEEYLEEENQALESMRLLICEPNYLSPVREQYWDDDLDCGSELPDEVFEALGKLNEVIKKQKPVSWSPGKYAAIVNLNDAQNQ